MKREGKNPFISLHRDRSPSRSRRPSNVPRSDKSPSQTRGDNHFYRPSSSHSPDPRDLGAKSRVCNAPHGSDSELTDGQSGSPRKSAKAIKHFLEGIPKSTENKAPAGFKILSRQKSEHLELDEQMQPTGQGVIKDPDSLGGGGKSSTEYRLDGLDSCLIQVKNYLEMIATRLCNDLPSQDKHEIRLGKKH